MNPPLNESGEQTTYTLEIVSQITGISSQTILHYQEVGLIRTSDYDDETVRTLRRIEHLQSTFGVNDSGLMLILELMEEVDRLRNKLRVRHR
jgi:MerR family transcriptional regulator/heat shock protein HspR